MANRKKGKKQVKDLARAKRLDAARAERIKGGFASALKPVRHVPDPIPIPYPTPG